MRLRGEHQGGRSRGGSFHVSHIRIPSFHAYLATTDWTLYAYAIDSEACASAGPNFSLQYFNFQRGRGAIKLAGSYNLCLDYGTNPKNGDIARLQTWSVLVRPGGVLLYIDIGEPGFVATADRRKTFTTPMPGMTISPLPGDVSGTPLLRSETSLTDPPSFQLFVWT